MSFSKRLAMLLPMIPLLGACSLFQSNEKVIEYDEEVKLHDGSMIWVHIKRHYVLVGGALGDPGAFKKGYAPKEVEISWDTGFPNVGNQKIIYSQGFAFINNFDNKWYLFGVNNTAYNTENRGTKINNADTYITIIDKLGNFYEINNSTEIPTEIKYINILNPTFADESLNNKKWTWQEKLNYQKQTNRTDLLELIKF